MPQASNTITIDHDEIRDWIEDRGGRPALVRATEDRHGSGLLRVDFGESEESLEEIDWDRFFKIFEANDLAFLYQNETAEGERSFFCKFVARQEHLEQIENGGVEDEPDDLDDEDADAEADEEALE